MLNIALSHSSLRDNGAVVGFWSNLMELKLDRGSRETLLVNDETKNLLRIYERYQALLAATIVAPGYNMY
jgi:hypothetical protein